MPRRLLLVVDALLLVAAAFLGVRLYEAWGSRPSAAPLEAPAAVAADTPAPPATTAARPPLNAFAAVADRNLFSPTRTETAPEPPRGSAGAGPAAPPAPKPRLYGIVLLPEGRDRAYLEDVQRRRVFGYSVGDVVGDARLERIQPDRVVLRRGSETFEVLLYDPAKPRQPSAPASVQSPESGSAGRPAVARPPVPVPPPGIRPPGRPRVPTVPAPPPPPPSGEGQEPPTEEE